MTLLFGTAQHASSLTPAIAAIAKMNNTRKARRGH
jgi:anaerobic C4-dicarboxylate transporter